MESYMWNPWTLDYRFARPAVLVYLLSHVIMWANGQADNFDMV